MLTHTNTYLLDFSLGAGQWPKAVGVHCSSQVRDGESIQFSLLAVNKHVFWLHFVFITFPPPLLRPAQLDFYQNTHIVIKICSNENINSITLCSCRNVLADTLYTIKKPWQMRLSSSVFESVCFSVVQLLRHLNGFWEAKHFVQTICFREIYYHTGHCLKKPANAIANNNSPSPDDRRKKKCWHFTIKYPCVICIILTFLQYASCRAHNRGMS